MVIGITDYEQLRQKEGKERFVDIPEASDDIQVVRASLSRLGFEENEIIFSLNPDYSDINQSVK